MEKFLKSSDENKRFYSILTSLCIPIIIQNLISTSINIIDTIMISGLGEVSLAAVGIGNQFFFLFNMCVTGILGGSSIFISQFLGKKDITNIKKISILSIIFSLVISIPFFISGTVFPERVAFIFSRDSEVIRECCDYLSIVALCYPLIAVSLALGICSRSVKDPSLGMRCSVVAIIVNVFFNYALIPGNFGFPALGIKGAAIATFIARAVEIILITGYIFIYKKDYIIKFSMKHLKMIDKNFVSVYCSKSIPVFLNDAFWATATVFYSIAYGIAGTSAIATSQIATTTGNFFIIATTSIAMGASIMLGNELGSDHIERALKYSKKLGFIIAIMGIIIGGLLTISIPVLLMLFNVTPNLEDVTKKIFIIMSIIMPLRALDTYMIIGVLRSGGDTRAALIIEMGSMWLVSIPLTFWAAIINLPIHIIFACSLTETIVKFVFGLLRCREKKWAKNIVKNIR